MKQSYKIYINDVVVVLAQSKQVFNIPKLMKSASIYYCNKDEELTKLIVALEIRSINDNLIIVSKDLDWLFNSFIKNFKIIKAGGGFVQNSFGEVLMMKRKGKWDLPKGKIERKESIQDGSVREVTEETGAKIQLVTAKLGLTYHTYKLRDKWILKESTWYFMQAKKSSVLKPQTEEGITEVKWVDKKEAKQLLKNSYNSIREVFEIASAHIKSLQ